VSEQKGGGKLAYSPRASGRRLVATG
jgi:hypothetical protein